MDQTVRYVLGGVAREARWRSEAEEPPPSKISVIDDRATADVALKRLRKGEYLLYSGDFQNARQLLSAVSRRLQKTARNPGTPEEVFAAQRRQRALTHEVLSRLLVPLDAGYRVELRRGPDVRAACEDVWGPPDPRGTVVSLRELQGMIGARQWREKGVEVPGLPGRIHPHYGVFAPTRPEYPRLIEQAPSPAGKRAFDIGTGTGVLGFLLLARGAAHVTGTDLDPRAVACANENAQHLGYADRFRAIEADLFPVEGQADLILCNPPWLPETPRTRIDRAIYDPEGRVLRRFLREGPSHLKPGGELWLLVSDLAELLGLRPKGAVESEITTAGLEIAWRKTATPLHPKASDVDDPLHAARARETTTLFGLRPGSKQ